MRRSVSYTAILLGLFLLFLAPLLRLYTYPRVHKVPTDTYTKAVAEGTGTYFSFSKLVDVGPVRLKNIKIVRGDPKASTSKVAVFDYSSNSIDLQGGGGIIGSETDRFAMDRVTAEAVHCCGEQPRHQGLTLKFPFDTKQRTYLFWDTAQDIRPGLTKAYPATYAGTTTIQGLTAYVFKQRIGPTLLGSIEIDGKTAGLTDTPKVFAFFRYTADATYYVEPVTGVILNGRQHAVRLLVRPDGGTIFVVADTDLGYDQATVNEQVDLAKQSISQLRLVSFWIPVVGPAIGLILIVVGLVLGVGVRQRVGGERREQKAPVPAS